MAKVFDVVIRVRSDGTSKVSRGLGNIGPAADGSATRVLSLNKALGLVAASGLAALGAGIAVAIRQGAAFEERLATLSAVTGETGAGLRSLEQRAREMGATTRFSASEAAEGMEFLARAGFNAKEVIAAIEPSLNLASAGALSLGEAADIVSNVLSGFGARADETSRFADVLAATAASANTNVLMLGEAMKDAAPVAAAVGLSVEQTSAAIGVLSNAGLQASRAGTGLKTVIASLIAPSAEAEAALAGLGLTLDQVNPTAHGFESVVRTLADAGIGAAEAFQIFGNRGAPAILALTSQQAELERLSQALGGAEGTAEDMAKTMEDTLLGAIREVKSALGEIGLVLVRDTGLLKGMKVAVQGLATALRALRNAGKGEILTADIGRAVADLRDELNNLGVVGERSIRRVSENALPAFMRAFNEMRIAGMDLAEIHAEIGDEANTLASEFTRLGVNVPPLFIEIVRQMEAAVAETQNLERATQDAGSSSRELSELEQQFAEDAARRARLAATALAEYANALNALLGGPYLELLDENNDPFLAQAKSAEKLQTEQERIDENNRRLGVTFTQTKTEAEKWAGAVSEVALALGEVNSELGAAVFNVADLIFSWDQLEDSTDRWAAALSAAAGILSALTDEAQNYSRELSSAGATIGAIVGAAGVGDPQTNAQIGSAIGEIVGTFIKKGVDRFLAEFGTGTVGKDLSFFIAQVEGATGKLGQQMIEGILGSLQGLADRIGGEITVAKFAVMIEGELVKVFANGLELVFNSVAEALPAVVSELLRTSTITGVGDQVRAALTSGNFSSFEELEAVLELAFELEGAAGQWAVKQRELNAEAQEAIRLAQAHGLSLDLVNARNQQRLDQLQREIDLAGSQGITNLIGLLRQVHGEQFAAAELQLAQAHLLALQLLANRDTLVELIAAGTALSSVAAGLLEMVDATVEGLLSGTLRIRRRRGGRGQSGPSVADELDRIFDSLPDIASGLANIIGDQRLIQELQITAQRMRILEWEIEIERLHEAGRLEGERYQEFLDMIARARDATDLWEDSLANVESAISDLFPSLPNAPGSGGTVSFSDESGQTGPFFLPPVLTTITPPLNAARPRDILGRFTDDTRGVSPLDLAADLADSFESGIEELLRGIERLIDFQRGLFTSELSPLTLEQQLDFAKGQFFASADTLAAQIAAGTFDVDEFTRMAQEVLQIGRDVAPRGSEEFRELFIEVNKALTRAQGLSAEAAGGSGKVDINTSAVEAELRLTRTEQLGELRVTRRVIQEMLDEIRRLREEQENSNLRDRIA